MRTEQMIRRSVDYYNNTKKKKRYMISDIIGFKHTF